MKDQHKQIKGYRDLSQAEIAMMNAIKDHGEDLRELIQELQALPMVDQRWVSIGKTDLQKGIMGLVRAVARPESF